MGASLFFMKKFFVKNLIQHCSLKQDRTEKELVWYMAEQAKTCSLYTNRTRSSASLWDNEICERSNDSFRFLGVTWDLSKTITLWFCPRQPAICSRLSLHREKPLNTTEIPLVYIEKRTKAQRKKEREMCVLLFVQSYGPSPWSGLIEQLCTGQNLGLNPPSPSNKPKSSSRISASLCVPSRCCGNVLLLLLSLYWSGCNCSKTRLFRGASSFHAEWGVVGFLNNSNASHSGSLSQRY